MRPVSAARSLSNSPVRALALLGCGLLAACSDAEPIGIHIKIAADGTAVVTCRSLQLVNVPGPMESGTSGVEWKERAQLFASRGDVAKLADLRIYDLEWKRTADTSLRLSCPRGSNAKWHTLLAPPPEGRASAAAALDPARPAAAIGETIRIEVEAPSDVTAVGHAPQARMVKSDKDGRRGILWIPVETARASGDPIVFDVSWR